MMGTAHIWACRNECWEYRLIGAWIIYFFSSLNLYTRLKSEILEVKHQNYGKLLKIWVCLPINDVFGNDFNENGQLAIKLQNPMMVKPEKIRLKAKSTHIIETTTVPWSQQSSANRSLKTNQIARKPFDKTENCVSCPTSFSNDKFVTSQVPHLNNQHDEKDANANKFHYNYVFDETT